MKNKIKLIVISAVFLAAQAALMFAGKVGFGFAVALSVGYSFALNLSGMHMPSFIFTALAFLSDCFILEKVHIGVYGIALFAVVLSSVLVFLMTKKGDFGLLLTDCMGMLTGYIPIHLGVKYIGALFLDGQTVSDITGYTHYPLMIGFISGAILAFFAVPAIRVLKRYGEEGKTE